MYFRIKSRFLTITIVLIILSCAKKGTPTGGPIDEDAPKVVMSAPDNKTLNFKGNKFKIYFDEYISLKNVEKQLIVSPPQKYKPLISPMGGVSKKYITVQLQDTLQANTTYSFNFGNSIVDANEGNPYKNLTYTFSTGDYIDSLEIRGQIIDPLLKKTKEEIAVFLYEFNESYTDSVVINEKPRYIASVDTSNNFSFNSIKEGQYKLVAITDKNEDYKWNPLREKIAYHSEVIELPTTTTPQLKLFKAIPDFEALKPKYEQKNQLIMGYRGAIENVSIQLTKGDTLIPSIVTPIQSKDSVEIWFQPIVTDSMAVTIEQGLYQQSYNVRLTKKDPDSLRINTSVSGVLHYRDTIALEYTTPVDKIRVDQIQLFYNDTVVVPITLDNRRNKKKTYINFNKEEQTKYTLSVLPGAVEDFFGTINKDTLRSTFRTSELSDYGNLVLTIENAKRYPIIVQLTDQKGEVKASQMITENIPINFETLQAAIYEVRIIYDDNNNGKWDTGSFRNKTQPEEVYHYSKSLDVRMNWDVNQPIDMSK